MEILWESSDHSLRVKLVYLVSYRMKYYYSGKTYPKQTQCLFFLNGLLENFGTVVKHYKDEDNSVFAYKEATKKALSTPKTIFIRDEIFSFACKYLDTNPLNKE